MGRMKEHFNFQMCKKCGGECCKKIPAPYIPKDIKKIFGTINKAIQSGTIAIDWWEGSKPLYFIRPKTKGVDKLFDPSWGGECIHLTLSGCSLPIDKRPFLCNALEPIEVNRCVDHCKISSKKYAALLWKKERIDFDALRDKGAYAKLR